MTEDAESRIIVGPLSDQPGRADGKPDRTPDDVGNPNFGNFLGEIHFPRLLRFSENLEIQRHDIAFGIDFCRPRVAFLLFYV